MLQDWNVVQILFVWSGHDCHDVTSETNIDNTVCLGATDRLRRPNSIDLRINALLKYSLSEVTFVWQHNLFHVWPFEPEAAALACVLLTADLF